MSYGYSTEDIARLSLTIGPHADELNEVFSALGLRADATGFLCNARRLDVGLWHPSTQFLIDRLAWIEEDEETATAWDKAALEAGTQTPLDGFHKVATLKNGETIWQEDYRHTVRMAE